MFEDIAIKGIDTIPIRITGTWLDINQYRCEGQASSSEPIVGIAFLRYNGHVEWCISERHSDKSLEMTLLLSNDFEEPNCLQISYSIGDGQRRINIKAEPNWSIPNIPKELDVIAGKVFTLTQVNGKPKVEVMGMFIPKRFTKTERSGIWHLKKSLLSTVSEPLISPLSYGRTGLFIDN